MSEQPGWYPDPGQPGSERYWFGAQWSEQTRPMGPMRPPGPPGRRHTARNVGISIAGLVALLVVVVVVLSGGGTSSTGSNPVAAKATKTACGDPAGNGPDVSPTALPHVGFGYAIKDSDGHVMNVTLVKVVDPAQATDQIPADAGKRFVGIEVILGNPGTSCTLSGDANLDMTVVGNDDQTYTADFTPLAACTNFDTGSFLLGPGERSTGCVAFQLPTSVAVSTVRFLVYPGGGTYGEWQVP